MSKREKIIIVLAIIAALYGAYEYIFSSPSESESADAKATLRKAKEFVENMEKSLAKESLSRSDSYIITHAEDEWGEDPFFVFPVHAKKEDIKKKAEEPTDLDLTYSGYLETGGHKIAIINGFQYRPGEELREGGLVLIEILPQRIVLEAKGAKRKKIVPLEEDV